MFKKKEKTEKAPKNKKVRTMKVGTQKKSPLVVGGGVLQANTKFGLDKKPPPPPHTTKKKKSFS